MEVRGEFHDPAALLPGKNPVPIEQEVGGPHSRSGYFGQYKNVLFLPAFEPRVV